MRKITKILCAIAVAALLTGVLVPMASAASAPAYNSIVYKVAQGDNLWSIAKKYGTTVTSIVALNNLANPNVIKIGQELIVHAAAKAPSDKQVQYVVAQGDTLWSIAKRYGTTVTKLIALNKITDPSKLLTGQRLILS